MNNKLQMKKLNDLSKEDKREIISIIRSMGYEGEITDEVVEQYGHKAILVLFPFLITVVAMALNAMISFQNAVAENNIPLIIDGVNKREEFVKIDLQSKKINLIESLNNQMTFSTNFINRF